MNTVLDMTIRFPDVVIVLEGLASFRSNQIGTEVVKFTPRQLNPRGSMIIELR